MSSSVAHHRKMADFAPVVSPRHVLVIASTDADAALAASALEASSTAHFAAAAIVAPSSCAAAWRYTQGKF